MERKIGETFEYEGKTLQVKEITGNTCKGCFFRGRCDEKLYKDVIGECIDRADKKDVIFVELPEQPAHEATETKEEPKLNLFEILKNCPKGEKFYSPMLGDVLFKSLTDGVVSVYQPQMESYFRFQPDGTKSWGAGLFTIECMLFPSRDQRDWSKVHFEIPVEKLPKSWKEFCETHEVKKGEAYIKDIPTMFVADETGDTRDVHADKNILPSEEACRQHLALMQLHQLRDCYRDGWKPEPDKTMWSITKDLRGCIEVYDFSGVSVFLSFQDEERAELFVQYFRNLIEEAGDLI